MNILVIEDDRLLKNALSLYLQAEGHQVNTASNGQEALALIEQKLEVQLIICDVLMPQIAGPTLILMLKKYFKTVSPVLLVISAVKGGENFIKKLGVHYDYFLSKPIDFKRLSDIVTQVTPVKNRSSVS